jgi:hypothetical protein
VRDGVAGGLGASAGDGDCEDATPRRADKSSTAQARPHCRLRLRSMTEETAASSSTRQPQQEKLVRQRWLTSTHKECSVPPRAKQHSNSNGYCGGSRQSWTASYGRKQCLLLRRI